MSRVHPILRVSVLAIPFLSSPSAWGQCLFEQKLTSPTPATSDNFGAALAMDGDVAAVGVPYSDLSASAGGAVECYRRDGERWELQQTLLSSASFSLRHQFGRSLAIDGERLFVGAHEYSDFYFSPVLGAAYVFRYFDPHPVEHIRAPGGGPYPRPWVEVQKLIASDGAHEDFFGYSLAASGDVIIVGASRHDRGLDSDADLGAAYIFRHDGTRFVEEQKLLSSDGDRGDWFGWEVALLGDVAIVGAPWHDQPSDDAGAAYVFRFNGVTWTETQKLTARNATSGAHFGLSMAISANTLMIGTFASGAGAAYVFEDLPGGWVQQQSLRARESQPGDRFGTVSLSNDIAVIGARGSQEARGMAYVYRRVGSQWVEGPRLMASDRQPGDEFGEAVAVSGDVAMVGSPDADNGLQDAGSVYSYTLKDLQLLATPRIVRVGDTVNFDTTRGEPGNPVTLFVVKLAGTPIFQRLPVLRFFDATGSWSVSGILQTSTGGVDVEFRTLSVNASGEIVCSNDALLTFQ